MAAERKVLTKGIESTNPCSGRYEGGEGVDVELMVDLDQVTEHSKALDFVSGTITRKEGGAKLWKSDASSLFFKVVPITRSVTQADDSYRMSAHAKVFYNDGSRYGGSIDVDVHFNKTEKKWMANLDIETGEDEKLTFKNLERKSKYFKHVGIDIDFTEKVTWPTVVVNDLLEAPANTKNRKIDPFQAFEDAGLKLAFDDSNSNKLDDPSPHNPWTRSDLYEAMMAYYDEVGKNDNIWCMMGTTPPDKRYMGFSFNKDGKSGFGLFTGHRSFEDLEATDAQKKAEAHRRFLHYLIHECGHCLGLKHTFEIGAPNSLSWMNYAWRYDTGHDPGSFYRDFRFTFSDQELLILRHSPGKSFRDACEPAYYNEIVHSGYETKSEAPDEDDEDDDEKDENTNQPMRKIGLDLKIPDQNSLGQLFSFEARIKNKGKLPVLIEGDLSVESGNLQVYITKPDGSVQSVEPFVRPVYTGRTKLRVLYTPSDEEGSDRYSELVKIGRGPHGYHMNEAGTYQIRAVYNGGKYKVSSETYSIEVQDGGHDHETRDEVLTAATLQTSSHTRFEKTLDYWKKMGGEPVHKKKNHVSTLVALFEGLAEDNGREADHADEESSTGRKKTKFGATKSVIEKETLLEHTKEIVEHYQNEGSQSDNMDYSSLVLARGSVYVKQNKTAEGDAEFDKMVGDLAARGVKRDVISSLTKKWKKIKNPTQKEDKYSAASLQKKVNAVLRWAPTVNGDGESDLSGVGLGKPFSNFDIEQIKKAAKIIEMLFVKYYDTHDLRATISYADKLQKSREVNNMVLRWALEAFIVHSDDAKKAGIRYPEPEDRDDSFDSDAAMVATRRVGRPREEWLNYWRCDADYNYHHRHWHIVYVVSNFLRNGVIRGAPPHLERQGELFGYMHSQMLARYNAERRSWGLPSVEAWRYEDFAPGFNAGMEFHNDRQWSRYAPRPNQRWPSGTIGTFRRWESAYNNAVQAGQVASGVEMTPNWSGHVLEPSSQIYSSRYGNYHNSGHGVFGSTGLGNATSYMNDTATAVRDPIFYRWHQKIEDLWQANNEFYRSELGEQPPAAVITADDIVLSTSRDPPSGFTQWSNGDWTGKAPEEETVLKTFLGPPRKKYEWDNKISHEKFYYHLRLKRTPGTSDREDVPLTIRIFICPQRSQRDRTKWIEMDKFVCNIEAGVDHVEVTRADVHSSVIKRLHRDMEGNEPDMERRFVRTESGFCECGWPYHMLLPRGTSTGEDYVIAVIATNNSVDRIGIRTTCGSMSYCGSRGQRYPDSRHMGYPFCNPMEFNREEIPIPEIFNRTPNAAVKSFKIQNNESEPPRVNAVDIWWPYNQLGLDDGTLRRQQSVTEFIQSGLVGAFRVLIDGDEARRSRSGRVLVRFEGRGSEGGEYIMRDVFLAQRRRNTVDVVPGTSVRVLADGRKTRFTVPETGIISDPLDIRFDPVGVDYFLTFTLESPGTLLPSNRSRQTSTYYITSANTGGDMSGNWSGRSYRRYGHIQCVGGIMDQI